MKNVTLMGRCPVCEAPKKIVYGIEPRHDGGFKFLMLDLYPVCAPCLPDFKRMVRFKTGAAHAGRL